MQNYPACRHRWMAVLKTNFTVLMLGTLLISCGVTKPTTLPRPTASGWCDLQKEYLSELQMECNSITGHVEVMSFVIAGESERLLTRCLPNVTEKNFDYRKISDGVAVPEYEEDWTGIIKASGGLKLQQIVKWLPDISASADSNRWFKVKIKIDSPEFVRISDPAAVFLDVMKNRNLTLAEKGTMQSCLKILCNESADVYIEVLLGYPEIIFTSGSAIEVKETIGWKIVGVEGEQIGKQNHSVKLMRDKALPKVAIAFRRLKPAKQFFRDQLCQN